MKAPNHTNIAHFIFNIQLKLNNHPKIFSRNLTIARQFPGGGGKSKFKQLGQGKCKLVTFLKL